MNGTRSYPAFPDFLSYWSSLLAVMRACCGGCTLYSMLTDKVSLYLEVECSVNCLGEFVRPLMIFLQKKG
jgi:hypothetical protein